MSVVTFGQVQVGARRWRIAVATRSMTWSEALTLAESLGRGWRLPQREELALLTDDTGGLAALSEIARQARPEVVVDPGTGRPRLWFWSASTVHGRAEMVWSYGLAVNSSFFNFEKDHGESVLCVMS